MPLKCEKRSPERVSMYFVRIKGLNEIRLQQSAYIIEKRMSHYKYVVHTPHPSNQNVYL